MWMHRRVTAQPYGQRELARKLAMQPTPLDVAPPGHRLHGLAARAEAARAWWRRERPLNAMLFVGLVAILGGIALARALDFRPAQHQGLWRGGLAHAFEAHYDQAFPLKQLGVNLWAAIDYQLFGEGLPGVVVGKDGWLYTDEEFKLDNDSPALVDRHLALVGWVGRALTQRHVALLVAVVPAKARVYPEHLGRRRPPGLRQALYARALDALQAEGVATVALLEPLSAGKREQPTFLRTDTHWTPYGARVAAQAVAMRARGLVEGGRAFHSQPDGSRTYRGDLFNFLPLDPWFASLLPPPDRLTPWRTMDSDHAGSLLGDAPAAQVALVGTSYSAEAQWNFAGALEQAMHADVLNYAKDGEGPFAPMLAYLDSDDFRTSPPKLVVWEVPERYLPLPQAALAAYHLPPGVSTGRVATSAAVRGPQAREGGSFSHVTSQP